jgi:hypothetical protein
VFNGLLLRKPEGLSVRLLRAVLSPEGVIVSVQIILKSHYLLVYTNLNADFTRYLSYFKLLSSI